jgi:hypothetical protein
VPAREQELRGGHTRQRMTPRSAAASKRLGYQRSHSGRIASTLSRRLMGRSYAQVSAPIQPASRILASVRPSPTGNIASSMRESL